MYATRAQSTRRVRLRHWRTPITALGYAGMGFLLGTVLTDVTLRFVFNQPIAGSIEYVSYWYMVAIAFCGIALAERYGEHIDAPLVFDRLPRSLRREFDIVSRVLFVILLVAIAWWGWQEALRQYDLGERGGAAGVAIWPGRFLVPLGATACAFEVIIRLVTHPSTPDDASSVVT